MLRGPGSRADGFLDALATALRSRPITVHGDLPPPRPPIPPEAPPSSVVITNYEDAEGPGAEMLVKPYRDRDLARSVRAALRVGS